VVLAGVTFVSSIALFLPITTLSDTAKHASVLLMFPLVPFVLTVTATWPRITTSYRLALTIIVATAAVCALALVVSRSVTDPVYEIVNRYEYGVLIAGASWVLVPALAGARRLS
jgi:hypothetical protein